MVALAGRNSGARIEVANHRHHAIVNQFLGDQSGGFGISLVVLADHLEADRFARDRDASCIGLLDGEAHAIVVVVAQVRLWPCEGCNRADTHHTIGCSRRRYKGCQQRR